MSMIGGKKIIALCTYGILEPQVFRFISDLNEMLRKENGMLFVYAMNTEIGNGGDFYLAESAVYDLIPYDIVDAVVIMAERIKGDDVVQRIIDRSNAKDIPAIVLDGEFENVSLVKFDYAKGFEAVVRHIIEHHHVKRPHFMAGKRHSEFSNERIEVFKKVIAENGFTYDDSMLSYGDFWSVPARAAARELLKRDELPDAVICANDIMAINVCDVFETAGVSVPGQVLVSGFDGLDEAFLSSPAVTTAICDSHSLATSILDAIHKALNGERNAQSWITPTFVANESCGCPRVDLASLSSVHEFNNRFYHHQDDIHIMQNLTAVIMGSTNIEEIPNHIRHSFTENLCVVVENACFNVEKNYFLENVPNTNRTVVYNVYDKEDRVFDYDPEGIVPNLDELLAKGYPLIFNAIEYMGKSIGFICYSFENYNLIDYSKTASMTNSIGMGLGGFITLHYQRFLRKQIQRMYENDELTGLYTRLAFISKLEALKTDPEFEGQKATVIMSDLNGLKKINDTMGHTAGDRAIAAVASSLKASSPVNSLCVRFGGDEMLALIPGEVDSNAIIKRMEEYLKIESDRLGYTVSASYGAGLVRFDESLNLEKLIANADNQMYRMKKEQKHLS